MLHLSFFLSLSYSLIVCETEASMLLLFKSSPNISLTKFDTMSCEIKLTFPDESF